MGIRYHNQRGYLVFACLQAIQYSGKEDVGSHIVIKRVVTYFSRGHRMTLRNRIMGLSAESSCEQCLRRYVKLTTTNLSFGKSPKAFGVK